MTSSYEQQQIDLIVKVEMLETQLTIANSILKSNLEWVRCGIGGNCSGYPKDHKDYILQKAYLDHYS